MDGDDYLYALPVIIRKVGPLLSSDIIVHSLYIKVIFRNKVTEIEKRIFIIVQLICMCQPLHVFANSSGCARFVATRYVAISMSP